VVFELFTERARRVVVLAQGEARELHHDWIGAEHLLLGILREGVSPSAQVLESLGIRHQPVRDEVVRVLGWYDRYRDGYLPFTRDAKALIELAARTGEQQHGHVGPDHLLIALLDAGPTLATQVLADMKADRGTIAEQLGKLLAASRTDVNVRRPG
jgi:ATP-dependent Clp protease ATP-binding subunit ClpC